MNSGHGVFTVSLDFELYWGVRDKRTIEEYRDNLLGVRNAVPDMLRMFRSHGIHATWATVGFLFFKDLEELRENIPHLLPTYSREELSPYKYIKEASSFDTVYHFAPDLIDNILNVDGQEIATHTFSHYYCLEGGQTLAQFEADIFSAVEVAKNKGVFIKSLVFPRNQWNPEYLEALRKFGVQCYRGNESNWMYNPRNSEGRSKLLRAMRLIDAYVNVSGHHTYDIGDCIRETPFNFPASRFLRPYTSKLSILDGLRLARIKKAMEDAAANGKIFHLWWHPHNFGTNIKHNLDFLAEILMYYKFLEQRHGMKSLNMGELCQIGNSMRAAVRVES